MALFSNAALELPVETGIRGPGGAGLLDSPPEFIGWVGAHIISRDAAAAGRKLSRERLDQTGLGPELVVNRYPRHAGPPSHLAEAGFGTELAHELAGG